METSYFVPGPHPARPVVVVADRGEVGRVGLDARVGWTKDDDAPDANDGRQASEAEIRFL